jgi:hypothetical protein
MRQITGKATAASGIAALMLVTMTASCGSTSKRTAPRTTVPADTGPISPVTAPPTLAQQYQAYMVALTTSPAWAIVEAQVAPQNSYMANFSGNAPTVNGAPLDEVTAEIHNVSSELQALSHDNQSNDASANIAADTEIEDVSLDLSTIPNDVSTGIDIADDINMVHVADVHVRTTLHLPLTGSGTVAAVPVASS